jgi:MFS family permease
MPLIVVNKGYVCRGVGGCFFMPFLFFWGRAPTLFWVVVSGTLFSLGCTLAPSFEVYYAMKALQGFTLTAGQTSGLAFIQDMFFFHEHARKIGIWTAIFLASPYFGPLFANFIIAGTGSWRGVYWLVFGLGCLNLVTLLCFLDETWYRRDIAPENQPAKGSRIFRIIGLWHIRVHRGYFGTVLNSYQRLGAVLLKPIMLPAMIY